MSEIENIVDLLTKADKAYRDGNPIMSDSEYDSLEDKLKELDPENPFLKNLSEGTFNLDTPLPIVLGSQNKAFSIKELQPFFNKVSDNPLHLSMKLDGMSCLLVYKEGRLVQALTRGNGFKGQDITYVARYIRLIPQNLPEPLNCYIRGEITISKEDLPKLQAEQQANGETPYKNTRNGAVALVKTSINRKYYKYLDFHAYNFVEY